MTNLVEKIVSEIKTANNARLDGSTISQDQTNEEIQRILSSHGISDDADEIERKLGLDGLNAIRDAEAGIY